MTTLSNLRLSLSKCPYCLKNIKINKPTDLYKRYCCYDHREKYQSLKYIKEGFKLDPARHKIWTRMKEKGELIWQKRERMDSELKLGRRER